MVPPFNLDLLGQMLSQCSTICDYMCLVACSNPVPLEYGERHNPLEVLGERGVDPSFVEMICVELGCAW